MRTGLLNHRIAGEYDYGISPFQLLELSVLSLLDFEIVRGRVAPTRRPKKSNLPALRISEFTFAALRLHLNQRLLYCDISFCPFVVADHVI